MGVTPERIPAGWYPDQSVPGYRFWDGARWTEHSVVAVQQQGVQQQGVPVPPGPHGQLGGQAQQAGQPQQVGVQYQQVGVQYYQQPYQQPAQFSQPVLAPPMGPADETRVRPGVQLAVAIVSILAGVTALFVVTTVPHSAGDTLISDGFYIKEAYYIFFLVAATESIIFGVALLLLLMAGVDALWVTRLTAAAAVLSVLVLICSAAAYIRYATADNGPATTAPGTTTPPRDSSDLLQ
jgi:hypothetical protein